MCGLSLVAATGGILSNCSAGASLCCDFSYCRAQVPGTRALVAAALELGSCSVGGLKRAGFNTCDTGA